MKSGALILVLVLGSTAAADRMPDLRIMRQPSPRHLKMRPRTSQLVPGPVPPRRTTPMPAAPRVSATQSEPIDDLEGLRDIKQRVSFSMNLGYQVDGARPSGKASLGSPAPAPGQDFATFRSYGFAEGFAATRGVGLTSLDTYFAFRFQATRKIEIANPDPDGAVDRPEVPVPPPIATWFERTGYELRSGWAEMRDFLPKRWGLKQLRLRAGDQFVYGPWILHLNGVHVSYDGPAVTASVYGGLRHSDYTRVQSEKRPGAAGVTVRVDLRDFTNKVPIVLAAEVLGLSGSEETGQPSSNHEQIQVDWRPRRDVVVIGQTRWLGGEVANQRVELRARYKQVTNFVFDLMRRRQADWRWDPSLVQRPPGDPRCGDAPSNMGSPTCLEAQRFLDLGPVLPQLIASVRAGTLIAENIDLLGRAAYAVDRTDDGEETTSFNSSYRELGGALAVRLRRQVAVGASVLNRDHDRAGLGEAAIYDERGTTQPLPASRYLGEDRFVELGTSVRLTLGARRFSTQLELFGRRTVYNETYVDSILAVPAIDVRGGGRFTVDAWVGRRIRLYAAYDVSSAFDSAPEITGYKSLRLAVTGVY
ncbi:MAG: hypothetical protein WKG01_22115 [Kofleriaceae bacterium]